MIKEKATHLNAEQQNTPQKLIYHLLMGLVAAHPDLFAAYNPSNNYHQAVNLRTVLTQKGEKSAKFELTIQISLKDGNLKETIDLTQFGQTKSLYTLEAIHGSEANELYSTTSELVKEFSRNPKNRKKAPGMLVNFFVDPSDNLVHLQSKDSNIDTSEILKILTESTFSCPTLKPGEILYSTMQKSTSSSTYLSKTSH